MSKHFEIRKVESERRVLAGVTCDICGRKATSDDWSEESYGVDEIRIERRHGQQFPEGDFTVLSSFDLCPDCWENKLLPWMQEQGATPSDVDYDTTFS